MKRSSHLHLKCINPPKWSDKCKLVRLKGGSLVENIFKRGIIQYIHNTRFVCLCVFFSFFVFFVCQFILITQPSAIYRSHGRLKKKQSSCSRILYKNKYCAFGIYFFRNKNGKRKIVCNYLICAQMSVSVSVCQCDGANEPDYSDYL